MTKEYYFQTLYPFQNDVLKIISSLQTGFYLTGGTASSRLYLKHRFSDDLDLFVNDDKNFSLWTERISVALANIPGFKLTINVKEERFVRMVLNNSTIDLKIELINDVPSHIGNIVTDPILGKVDSAENILANKVTAVLSRNEPKDLADIWGFCLKMGLSLESAITQAKSKAAGIFPADLARILCSVEANDYKVIRWIEPPSMEVFIQDLNRLGDKLIAPNI